MAEMHGCEHTGRLYSIGRHASEAIKVTVKLLVRHLKYVFNVQHAVSPVVLSEADAGVLFAQTGQSGSSL